MKVRFLKVLRAIFGLDEPVEAKETVALGRAHALIQHRRPTRWLAEGVPDSDSYVPVGQDEETWNLITDAGRDFLHQQGYGDAGLGANGLNYIALSNDAVTETTASTTLSNEIVANGLQRAQGTVAHTAGTNTTTIQKTFSALRSAAS
jgi:hypothetical protein